MKYIKTQSNDAIEKILRFWNVNRNDKLAGIIALDAYESGEVIGSKFPDGLKETTLFDINEKYKIPGDKKLIYRTELAKKYPFLKEKNMLDLLINIIS